ncbi:hypothetical protein FOA52_014650 [Chlamydomonas sp. UWO 241]|nr:hypothetical protein FOA52_014650 [Chlamydomonas sp. UWO 241]
MFAMFGAPAKEEDGGEQVVEGAGGRAGESGLGLGGFDIWGAAAAAAKTFQETAGEIVKTVGDTDWNSELSSFSQGVSHEGEEIGQTLAHVRDGEDGEKSEEKGDGDAEDVAISVERKLQAAALLATQFGKTLWGSAAQMIEQVREDIDEEITQAAREGKAAARKGAKASAAPASTQAGSGAAADDSAVSAGAAAAEAAATVGAAAAPALTQAPLAQRGSGSGAGVVTEKQLIAMQRDSNTYLDEADDEDDFDTWHASFSLVYMQPDIDALLSSNAFMADLHARLVPGIVEHEDFWTRYFYQLSLLTRAAGGGSGGVLGAPAAAAAAPAEQPSLVAAAEEEDGGEAGAGGDAAGGAEAAGPSEAQEAEGAGAQAEALEDEAEAGSPQAEEAAEQAGAPAQGAAADAADAAAPESRETEAAEAGVSAADEAAEPSGDDADSVVVVEPAAGQDDEGEAEPSAVRASGSGEAAGAAEAKAEAGRGVGDGEDGGAPVSASAEKKKAAGGDDGYDSDDLDWGEH